MHLDPQQRWQTAAEAGAALEPIMASHAAGGGSTATAARRGVQPADDRKCLMVVESADAAQTKIRDFFTGLGYRVLITENPQRALSRFSRSPFPADCLVLSTFTLGEDALEAFNRISEDSFLADVPAILLVDSKHHEVIPRARSDALRKVVVMPVPVPKLRATIASLTTLHE
jgi:CheY-like chemotaxis protein